MAATGGTAEPGPAGRRVLDLLGRQAELYRRLEQLADGQRRAIEGEDANPLLKLLTERQKLTATLTMLNAELAPYRTRWHEIVDAMPVGDRQRLEALVSEGSERLSRILAQDEADGRLLAAQKSRTARSLGELDTARRTLVAYGHTAGATAGTGPRLDDTEA